MKESEILKRLSVVHANSREWEPEELKILKFAISKGYRPHEIKKANILPGRSSDSIYHQILRIRER